jgi:hypothetical protein
MLGGTLPCGRVLQPNVRYDEGKPRSFLALAVRAWQLKSYPARKHSAGGWVRQSGIMATKASLRCRRH